MPSSGSVGTIGLQAVLNLSQFSPSVKAFIGGVNSMNASTASMATKTSSNLQLVAASLKSLGVSAAQTKQVMASLVIGDIYASLQSQIDRVTSSVQNLGKSASNIGASGGLGSLIFGSGGMGGAGGIVGTIGQIFSGTGGIFGVLGNIWNIISPKASASEATNHVNVFGGAWQRVKTIIGGVITIDIWRTISNGLQNVAKDALKAVDSFQRLRIMFESLIAVDISKALGMTAEEALSKAVAPAQALLMWVRRLAVETPFTVKSLTEMVAWGKAFGFTTDKTKELTLAIGNFTSAMGLQDENMSRIMYHFGQMNALGKVMGRQLLGLGQDLVPVAKIVQTIATEMGLTVQEVRDQMAAGAIRPEVFIGEFMKMVETQFPNSMKRMAQTITGVKQNIQDFIQTLFGMELLGPVVDKITLSLYNFLQTLLSAESIKKFTIFGQLLSDTFDTISLTISNMLLPSIRKFLDEIGLGNITLWTFVKIIMYVVEATRLFILGISSVLDHLGPLIKSIQEKFKGLVELPNKSFGWGANIILYFAKGMVFGLSYVVKALTYLFNLISGALSSHSPPELLPDLPLWGRNAMQSYLEGWTTADFSVFDDVSSIIEQYIRSMPEMSDTDMLVNIIGSRSAIDKLIDQLKTTGDIGMDALQAVASSTGIASQAIEDYIVNLVNLERAQINLNNVTKYYDDILKDLEAQKAALHKEEEDTGRIREIDKAINTGLLTQQEFENLSIEKKGILLDQQIEKTKAEKETAISSAQAQVDAAKELYDITKAYLEIQIKNNELLKEQLDLIKSAAGGGGGEPDPEEAFVGDWGFDETGFETTTGDIRKQLDALWAEVWAYLYKLRKELETTFAPLNDPFEDMVISIDKLKKSIAEFINSKEFTDFKEFLLRLITAAPSAFLTVTLRDLRGINRSLKEIFENLGINISLIDILYVLLFPLLPLLGGFVLFLATISGLYSATNAGLKLISESIEEISNALKELDIEVQEKDVIGIIVKAFAVAARMIKFYLELPMRLIDGFVKGVIGFFEELNKKLVGESIIPDMLVAMSTAFTTWITDTLLAIGGFVTDMIGKFTENITEFYTAGYDLIYQVGLGIWYAFFAPDVGLIAKVGKYVSETATAVTSKLLEWYTAGKLIIEQIGNGIWTAFFAPSTGVISKLGGYVSQAASSVTSKMTEWSTAGANLIGGIIAGIGSQSGKLWTAIVDLIRKALGIFKKESEEDSPSKKTAKVGMYMMMGLEKGMLDRLSMTKRIVSGAMQEVMEVYNSGINSIASPYMNYSYGVSGGSYGSALGNSTTNYIDNSVSMQMSPTYNGSESPIRLKHDMSAAIAAMRR